MTFRDALRQQAEYCGKLGSPFMQRLLDLLADRMTDEGAIANRLFNWPGDISPMGASLPLRLAGGLHALKLQGFDPLVEVYPPNEVPDDALWSSITNAIAENEGFLQTWLDSPPQTNEVRRSAALLPAAALVAHRTGLPLSLIELGASAGLNLNFDRYGVETPSGMIGADDPVVTLRPKWSGDTPVRHPINVAARNACDIAPIDPKSDIGRMRLLAYLWPDQPTRLARTLAAIDTADTQVQPASADTFLETALPATPGNARFIFHTVAWQYFPKDVQEISRALIEQAGRAADAQTPLAWFSTEADGNPRGAALTLRFWPGDLHLDLGRADFHGRWINWKAPARI